MKEEEQQLEEEKIISFFAYETIGVGRGPVGLEPLFTAIDDYFLLTKEEKDGRRTDY